MANEPENAMDLKIRQFTLIVKNQPEALEFYTKKVGFEIKTDYTPSEGYRWVTVGPKGQELELALFEEGTKDPNNWAITWKSGNIPPIVIRAGDVKKIAAEMKKRGVHFVQEPKEYPWGIAATFSDPSGNLFSLNQLPEKGAW